MKIITTLTEWQQQRKTFLSEHCGFVPTMGNLHDGHASLLRRCKCENAISILSIFVNPTQFSNQDDFDRYPKTRAEDLAVAEQCGVDVVFFPTEKELYPDAYAFRIQEMKCSETLEGQFRPGHFSGVLTVVMKLLNLVQPARVYLGEKDYQQYRLIADMVKAFFLPIDVILCETMRWPSGLAYSSRNSRLNPQQLAFAHEFSRVFHASKLSIAEIKSWLKEKNIRIDYLQELDGRRYAAVWIGDVRLIDNYVC